MINRNTRYNEQEYEDKRKEAHKIFTQKRENLSTAWIDYQKAFDTVPHSWVEKSLELVGVNSKIVRFCTLSLWRIKHNASVKNKEGSHAVTTHSRTKSSGIPRGVVWGVQTPPEIPMISVESSIA